MFESKPASSVEVVYPKEEIDDVVADIESIADWEDAGIETDWSEYPFEYSQLMVIWREAEREIARLHNARFQAVLKGFLK